MERSGCLKMEGAPYAKRCKIWRRQRAEHQRVHGEGSLMRIHLRGWLTEIVGNRRIMYGWEICGTVQSA